MVIKMNKKITTESKRNFKTQALTELVLMIAILIFINLVGAYYFFRFDLTKEKRYTLSNASINLAKQVDEVFYAKVYLEGEFPAGFKRMSKSVREMLDEFAAYSGGNIQYEFIDPFAEADNKKSADIIEELAYFGALDNKVVFGSINRAGILGADWELDDRQSAYDVAGIKEFGLEDWLK